MNAAAPRSTTNGSCNVGKPNAIGLVPVAGPLEPGAATWGLLLTLWIPISPARATIST